MKAIMFMSEMHMLCSNLRSPLHRFTHAFVSLNEGIDKAENTNEIELTCNIEISQLINFSACLVKRSEIIHG